MTWDDAEWSTFLEAGFLAILEAADEGMVVFDQEGRCRMMGRRVGELFGVEPAVHVGRPRVEVLRTLAQCCEDPDTFLATVGKNDLLDAPVTLPTIDLRHPRPCTLLWTSFPVAAGGRALGRLGLVRDVTRERSAERSLRQLQAQLQEVSPMDPLTGLPNARRFREELEREHGRSGRSWESYAVLRFDVVGMGAINEELGVTTGDGILEHVALRLRSCKRDYDILARFDGAEFVLLLPASDGEAARIVADRMLGAVNAHDFALQDKRPVAVTVGGAVWRPPSDETFDGVLRRADGARRAATPGAVNIDVTAPGAKQG